MRVNIIKSLREVANETTRRARQNSHKTYFYTVHISTATNPLLLMLHLGNIKFII